MHVRGMKIERNFSLGYHDVVCTGKQEKCIICVLNVAIVSLSLYAMFSQSFRQPNFLKEIATTPVHVKHSCIMEIQALSRRRHKVSP